jgi:diadenosine tetraphosphate (Ap4A) HIT family hydrolase
MKHPRVPMDLAKLVKASTSGRCFICEFLRGSSEFAHVTVAETETAFAFLSKYPTLFGSRAANSHVHWHIAPLPAGIPLEQQQYYALMAEHGIIEVEAEELQNYVARLQRYLQHTPSVDTL